MNEISRRQFLYTVGGIAAAKALGGVELREPEKFEKVIGIGTEPERGGAVEEAIAMMKSGETLMAATMERPKLLRVKSEAEKEFWVELIRNGLEGAALRGGNTPLLVQRMWTADFKRWYEYNGQVENLLLNEIEFEVVKIEAIKNGDIYDYFGYISNMTGDPSRWRVHIGSFDPNADHFAFNNLTVVPREGIETNVHEARYGMMVQRTIYDNKVFNMLRAWMNLRESMVDGLGDGELFSYIDAIKLPEHFDKDGHPLDYFFKDGFVVGGDIWSAGGACAGVTTTGKGAYRASKRGWMKIVKSQPHSESPYYVNYEDGDTIDCTAAYVTANTRIDLVLQNTSGERIWLVPRAQVIYPDEIVGPLPNSMQKPSSVKLLISMTFTDKKPSWEDSQSVEDEFNKFVEYRKEYGGGPDDGFDLEP